MPHSYKPRKADSYDDEAEAHVRDPNTPDPLRGWGRKWIAAYQSSGVVFEACQKARISRRAVMYRQAEEPEFARLVTEARENFVDRIEQKAGQRALGGSDKMLEFMLRSKRPEEFDRPRQLQAKVDATVDANVHEEIAYDTNQLADILSILDQAGAIRSGSQGEDSEEPNAEAD